MSLKEYVQKRSFEKTPEPKGGQVNKASGGECHFYIQRHDATRLHYDFRLEIDGVLKSWAVPKGPSLEPLSKHLAMHVEDHPLEYGTFEGNIPKGEYGGGSVMLWDRGTFELLGDVPALKQIERGDLKFRLHGEKLKGEFALILMRGRGKGNEWLIIKKKDEEAKPRWNIEDFARSVKTGRTQQEIAEDLPPVIADKPATKQAVKSVKKNSPKRLSKAAREMPEGAVRADMPKSVDPMMATLVTEPPASPDWLYEVKWDGIRGICFVEDGQLRIQSRRGNRCEQQYPELSVLPHYVTATNAILDGEIAVLDETGRPSFSLIQPRIAVADPNSVAHLSRKTPVTLFLFDLLYLDGYDLRGCPLTERKRLLSEVIERTGTVRVSDHFVAKGHEMLEAARQSGLEGVVAKKLDSKYEGRRSKCWLKMKVVNEQEFVIGGFTHGERSYFSSLVLGLYEGDKLVHVGQVGTGFNDKTLPEIFKKLEPLITEKRPFADKPTRMLRKVTWVRPELVCQAKFLEFTPDGLLRAPVFLGLRPDKNPKECVREIAASVDEITDDKETETSARLAPPDQQKFNNLNKIFFPKDGVTKGDVIQYYEDVAELILPHLQDRPLSLKRYPNGIHADYFFQKNVADKKFPEWIRTEPIESESQGHVIEYVICNEKPTLLYLANLGCIDHNPWMSRVGSLDNPDFVLIDLDPYECSYDQIIEAALLTRKSLDEIGLEGYPKTTGGDGMHIYIPLEPIYSYDQVRSFAEVLWHVVGAKKPDLFTTPRAVARRKKGRVYFDYLQIGKSKTIAAPYVLRAHDGAPVATPLAWKEVKKGLTPGQFNIRNAVARFQKLGNVFGGVLANKQRLEGAIERLSELLQRAK